MDVQEILAKLQTYDRKFPRQALRAAITQREAITPHLLELFKDPQAVLDKMLADSNYMAPTYALFLLAQFREKRAYPLIVDYFSLPGDDPEEVFGDLVTEDLGRILASVSHGDISLIHRLVENPNINEWTRGAGLAAIITLVAVNELPREAAVDYFRHLFQTLPRTSASDADLIWSELVSASCDLYPEELLGEIREAFAGGLVAEDYIDLDWITQIMAKGKEAVLEELRGDSHHQLVRDVIREMEWWAAFREPEPPTVHSESEDFLSERATQRSPSTPPAPVSRLNLGRNAPCWCGSGKKYKHCHWQSDQSG